MAKFQNFEKSFRKLINLFNWKFYQTADLKMHLTHCGYLMGQTLSEPITAKDTAHCHNKSFYVGSSSMQGWRVKMEDAHTHILSLPDDPEAAFFAVFDGHGGSKVAEYAGKHLHKYIVNRPEYRESNYAEAMKQAFLELDNVMREEESLTTEQSGSTAVAILIRKNRLYCANVGDSRAVACIMGKAEPLSNDHKPYSGPEAERIRAAGGFVEFNRVNGNLALSRALGDFIFKQNATKSAKEQIVTAYPDVEVRDITLEWEFIVLACDGIWDVMSSEEVVAYVRENIAKGLEPEEICENLMTRCLAPDCQMAGLGCDNMTVVIVCFLGGGSYADLQKHFRKNPMYSDEESEENSVSGEENVHKNEEVPPKTDEDLNNLVK